MHDSDGSRQTPWPLQLHGREHPLLGQTQFELQLQVPLPSAPSKQTPLPEQVPLPGHLALQINPENVALQMHFPALCSHTPLPLHGFSAPPGHEKLQFLPQYPLKQEQEPSPALPLLQVPYTHVHTPLQSGPYCCSVWQEAQRLVVLLMVSSQDRPQKPALQLQRPVWRMQLPRSLQIFPLFTGQEMVQFAPA
jgi:hypothetical protein